MEGLNLEDLNFDTDSLQLFDDEGNLEASTSPETTAGDTPPSAGSELINATKESTDDITITDGDDTATAGQESVATGKDDTQVQAGKTATGEEGSDSSSPKLNETEQLYSNLAAQFKSEGVLPGLENIEDIKDLTALNEAIRKEVESRFSDEQKSIKEAVKVGAEPTEVSEKLSTISKLESVLKDTFGYAIMLEGRGYSEWIAEPEETILKKLKETIEDYHFHVYEIGKEINVHNVDEVINRLTDL
jgi:hypothetical protein